MFKRAVLLLMLFALSVVMVRGQDDAPLPVAFESNDLLFMADFATPPMSLDELFAGQQGLTESGIGGYYAAWSPDGTKLVYFLGTALMVREGDESIKVADISGFDTDASLSWTKDGRIAYGISTPVINSSGNYTGQYTLEVSTIAPEAGAAPQVVASNLPIGTMCGIGTTDPREGAAWGEMGTMRNAGILAVTQYGVIYPGDCSGTKMSLTRPSGETVAFAGGDLIRAVVAPDESQLAGIAFDETAGVNKIVVVDLATLEETTLMTTESPSIVAWDKDGSLYYATEIQTHNLLNSLTPEQKATLRTAMQTDELDTGMFSANTIHIFHRAVDGTEKALIQKDGYAVTRLVVKNDRLIYSTVSNGDDWVKAMLDGRLFGDVYFENARPYIPVRVTMFWLKLDAQPYTLPGDLRRMAVAP